MYITIHFTTLQSTLIIMNNLQTEESPVHIDPKTGLQYTTVADDSAEYIIMSEYIRRRHEADLLKDKLADKLYDTSIRNVIKRGDIILYKQGTHFFIDWNKYKNWVFSRHKRMPKKK